MIKFKIKVMLAMREMTHKELAEATGIRLPTISDLCNNKNTKFVSLEALDRMCKVLDCQLNDLMVYIPDKTPEKKEEQV